jgi:hypothetical protein
MIGSLAMSLYVFAHKGLLEACSLMKQCMPARDSARDTHLVGEAPTLSLLGPAMHVLQCIVFKA